MSYTNHNAGEMLSNLETAEWNWLTFNASGTALHALSMRCRTFGDWPRVATTSCNRTGKLTVPGLFSRAYRGGLPRCHQCCKATGMPTGTGSPKNGNARCRRVAEKRVAMRREAMGA